MDQEFKEWLLRHRQLERQMERKLRQLISEQQWLDAVNKFEHAYRGQEVFHWLPNGLSREETLADLKSSFPGDMRHTRLLETRITVVTVIPA